MYCTNISYIEKKIRIIFQLNLSFPHLIMSVLLWTLPEFFCQFFLLFGTIFCIKRVTFRLNLVGCLIFEIYLRISDTMMALGSMQKLNFISLFFCQLNSTGFSKIRLTYTSWRYGTLDKSPFCGSLLFHCYPPPVFHLVICPIVLGWFYDNPVFPFCLLYAQKWVTQL